MDADDNKTDIEQNGGRIDVNGNQDNIDKKEEEDQRATSGKEDDGNRTKSENERRFEEDMATIELNKPW